MFSQHHKKEEKMRKNNWLVIFLVLVVPAMMFTVSCAKKPVETAPAETAQPAEPQPEQDTTAEDQDAAEKARLEQERLAAEEAARKAMMTFTEEDINFEFDSSALVPEAQDILIRKADFMRANSSVTITIEGHCDERGTDAYNMALGERRAEAAREFLSNLGISISRLSIISYGEERPVDPGKNEAAWAKNRRAHFVID
jgi:peptidoglycan-associated lipoprotein